ncbi:MAG: selenide, water dikinase SelD [Prolixibacteraceae bacterium]|jgi:selenide,water dikinase|nr:selenide, water dikinase SelD [Prolixibacteraceae bacterium]NLX27715.1 selenide, water dikinase SelD [Bacteroidales bacterium]HNQ37250.1 selenide, water dikinase SelD [Prolixibacteraceae bacterium]HPJ78564.1 selenide, water dikinase SelD [Prolixibacteraceae bacterium]HRV89680.1 selenide, water dikinase SelD [Prolixibacteraceae bacterium]
MKKEEEPIKLTSYSHGAGCGCKISPAILETILKSEAPVPADPRLLVGNESRDDAAVYDLGDGTALISTTDFFMPIVDDPFTFGRIAAANAISDVYAMGGKPLLAVAILGWPVAKIGAEVAARVVEGGRHTCHQAGILLAGGHSIDSPEPIFGLAVTGQVPVAHLKRNDTALEGCQLFLTKPLGVGILTTARKQGVLRQDDEEEAVRSMTTLNSVGLELASLPGVKAMTDVTGFGLLGHLSEMCQGSRLSASLCYDAIPRFATVEAYIAMGCIPGGTHRNWSSYGHRVGMAPDDPRRLLLCDPQTNGGLLVAVEPSDSHTVALCLARHGLQTTPIGEITPPGDHLITLC